ncbi:MAG: heavy metal translocating P-type ATPase, partial [Clostridia bacterium]|nr:heavy metal translocating P-type ATPase [Clostridia bacterium]
SDIPLAKRIAKKTMRIVRENVVFSLAIKFGVLILSAVGLANMWLAVFADVGVAVLAILNAMRALKIK